MNENLTIFENSPLITALSSSTGDDAENELNTNDVSATRTIQMLATMLPESPIVSNIPPPSRSLIKQQTHNSNVLNVTMLPTVSGAREMTITPMPTVRAVTDDVASNQIKNTQLTTTIVTATTTKHQHHQHNASRNAGSRAAIKSSSPSAAASNNTVSPKSHKPDAPMLNYIFDSHLATNKHHHYDPRYVLSFAFFMFYLHLCGMLCYGCYLCHFVGK